MCIPYTYYIYTVCGFSSYSILYTVYTIVCVNFEIFWFCGRTVKSSFLGTTPLTISYTKLWVNYNWYYSNLHISFANNFFTNSLQFNICNILTYVALVHFSSTYRFGLVSSYHMEYEIIGNNRVWDILFGFIWPHLT